jgi:hypothetical protein
MGRISTVGSIATAKPYPITDGRKHSRSQDSCELGVGRVTCRGGLAAGRSFDSWPIREHGPAALIRRVRAAEDGDPDCERWPRHKPRDDATVVYWQHAW